MALRDWLEDVRRERAEYGSSTAALGALQQAWQGVLRRTLGRRHSGEPIWDRSDEWDVLCVLDACRVDLMREVASEYEFLPASADIGTIESVGTTSEEWLHRTFDPEYEAEMARTGYITANYFSDRSESHEARWDNLPLDERRFGLLHEAWKTTEPVDGDRVPSISPADMTEYALRTWRSREELGINRLVVHYMQPHAPFRSHPEWNVGNDNVWDRHRRGLVKTDEVWEAYLDNLRWVLDGVRPLSERIAGDVVFTSDHGNAMGEWMVWAHPPETPVSVVRMVPWVPIEGAAEDGPFPDGPVVPGEQIDAVRDERLRALGYK